MFKLTKTRSYQVLLEELETLREEIKDANLIVSALRENRFDEYEENRVLTKGSLAHNLQKMQYEMSKLAKQEQERNWITQGMAKFAEILRSDFEEIKELGHRVMTNLVKYLGAHQGGLFIINEEYAEDIHLELIACYAYSRNRYLKKRFKLDIVQGLGEGLIGQTFISRKSNYLEEIPDNYTNISSGLGEAQPRHLILIPLIAHDETFGVVEIASLQKFDAHHIEFVEKVGESIASTLLSAKISEKTHILLQATKEQTEALQAQEEEMRQNMEELQATQEEMRRVNQELENTFSAIDSSMLSAEFTPDGRIIKVNKRFLKFMGYREDEIMENYHKILLFDEEAASPAYQKFWQDLQEGKNQTGEFRRRSKRGFRLWIRGSYYPVLDDAGKVRKILKIAYDITLEKEQEVKLFEQQELIEQNRALLKERAKSIQDKAYKRIKDLKSQLEDKDQTIAQLKEEIELLARFK